MNPNGNRPQHTLIMLCDTMSACTLQAIFYGKSESAPDQKVLLVIWSAFFMAPALFFFPILFRLANTPPKSITLQTNSWKSWRNHDKQMGIEDGPEVDADYVQGRDMAGHTAAEKTVLSPQKYHQNTAENVLNVGLDLSDMIQREKELAGQRVVLHTTDAYRDICRLQHTVMMVNVLTAISLVLLCIEIIGTVMEQDAENYSVLNLTLSLGAVSAILSIYAVPAVAFRHQASVTRVLVFNTLVALPLIFCGTLLLSSHLTVAMGACLGGLVSLSGLYALQILHQYEDEFIKLEQYDIEQRRGNPSHVDHTAASKIQNAFRSHRAIIVSARAKEFQIWKNECRETRRVMAIIVYSALWLVTAVLFYTNIIFAATFDSETSRGWLTTCTLAILIEAAVQQPVIFLATGVLGDFIEEGGELLVELLNI
ncbi:unnamed protein product [Discosporangium mesarthrocarpum]